MSNRRLVADIGGTNARFAVREGGRLCNARNFAVGDYDSIDAALAEYLRSLSYSPDDATLAVAGPVVDGCARMSNSNWTVSAARLGDRFGIPVTIVNDFAAVAMGVPHLTGGDLAKIGRGKRIRRAPLVALGPGTGLGVSAAIPAGNEWRIIASEGGHAALPLETDYERRIAAVLAKQWGRVFAELVLSGPGMVRLYRAICEIDGEPSPCESAAGITKTGLRNPGGAARKTLEVFCALLGAMAGDLALTFGATGGVYIAGGIVPRLGDFLKHSDFRNRFERKGTVEYWVRTIPTYVILADHPAFAGLGL